MVVIGELSANSFPTTALQIPTSWNQPLRSRYRLRAARTRGANSRSRDQDQPKMSDSCKPATTFAGKTVASNASTAVSKTLFEYDNGEEQVS